LIEDDEEEAIEVLKKKMNIQKKIKKK